MCGPFTANILPVRAEEALVAGWYKNNTKAQITLDGFGCLDSPSPSLAFNVMGTSYPFGFNKSFLILNYVALN